MAVMPRTGRQALPIPQEPIVDASGCATIPFYQFLQALFARTGGTIGNGLSIGHSVSPDLSKLVISTTPGTSDDALTLALIGSDPDAGQSFIPVAPFDPSDLLTLLLTLPDDAPVPVVDALPLALLLLEDAPPSATGRPYAATIPGDGVSSTFTVTHGLGTQDVEVVIRDPADGFARVVGVDDRAPTPNTVEIIFGAPLAVGASFRVIISRM